MEMVQWKRVSLLTNVARDTTSMKYLTREFNASCDVDQFIPEALPFPTLYVMFCETWH